MKLATLACLAALSVWGMGAHAAPGEPAQTAPVPAADPGPARQAAPETPRPETGRAEPAKADQPRAATGSRERRRRSYAACNRASHQRGYVGGKRRRFLIRCRLGYERTRGQPVQAPAAPPARRP